MLRHFIGAAAGGLAGYFVLYRLIGCSDGTCPMTANPYISTLLGIAIGLLIVGGKASPANTSGDGGKIRASEAVYRKITAHEAKTRMDSGDEVVVLDVRTKDEYNAEHIPNAILIPSKTIRGEKPESLPDFDAEILIYCRSGRRSAKAARNLIKIGYTNVFDFGGINSWPYDTVKKQ